MLETVEENKVHRRIKEQKADGFIMLFEYTYSQTFIYFTHHPNTVNRWYLTKPVLTGSQSQTENLKVTEDAVSV